MAVGNENEKLYALINGAPAVAGQSAESVQAAAALAAAEAAAQNTDYSRTADAQLDKAIGDYLSKRGFIYDIGNDKNYQEFAREYSQNALRGREAAKQTAKQLSGGFTPTYADAVGSAVQNDIAANASSYAPVFRQLGQQEEAARLAQAGNAAQLYGQIADTAYGRQRDTQGDRMQYMQYLANRYGDARQADVQRAGFAGDVYRAQLSGATENATQARELDNRRYQFDDQSATSRAQLAADQNAFDQKLRYTAAEDAYKDRLAAQKKAATAEKQAATEKKKAAAETEKSKEKYAKLARLFEASRNEDGTYSFIKSERVNNQLDLNGDGKVDIKDYHRAQVGAQKGVLPDYDPLTLSKGSTNATKFISSVLGHYGDKVKSMSTDTLGAMMKRNNLSDEDSAIVWSYFFG
jgi:hypothetical protein